MDDILLKQTYHKWERKSYLLISDDRQISIDWFNKLKEKLFIDSTDIIIIENRDQIKIEDIRCLQRQIKLKPYNSSHKLVFIQNADNLRKETANAMLKTLEEPPDRTLIVLAASNTEKLLPTIVSRCQIIRLKSKKEDDTFVGSNSDIGRELDIISKMKIYEKFNYVKQLIRKENLNEWILQLILYFRQNVHLKTNRIFLKKLLQCHKLLTDTNASKRLILENLLLEI